MINALADYLEAQGYSNIYIDYMPSVDTQPEAIFLGKWNHTVPEINDGTGTQYIQIQVRRKTYGTASTVAEALFKLLDSGLDETVIQLNTNTWCIARPRRGPIILDRTEKTTTFYFELALWGEN